MRSHFLIASLLLASGAHASWFSGKDSATPQYADWDQKQLSEWLAEHDIAYTKDSTTEQLTELVKSNWNAGTQWTSEQVESVQQVYQDLKESAFDTWSESQLRDFLVRQGVVAPSGPREQLVLLAKKQYASYSSAASSLSAAASTAVYGDKGHQASKSATSASKTVSSVASSASSSASSLASSASSAVAAVVATGTATAKQTLDDSKDYVYSSWDDNQLRSYLEDKGVIKTKSQATRDELLAKMKTTYAAATNPVWKAWSDSYLWEWLHSRGIIRTDFEKKQDKLQKVAEKYYYGAQDTAYSQWTESELKAWLVSHDLIKSDAQLKKDKLYRLVSDNYASAHSTVWGGWKDSDLRDWLIEHGYLRSDAQVERDELIKLMNQKYTDVTSKSAAYLTWPDARLRAYLRANGVDDSNIPTTRPGLLQETRIRWLQANTRVESLLQKIRDAVGSSVERAEEQLGTILELISGTSDRVAAKGKEVKYEAAKTASEKAASASASASSLSASAAKASKSAKSEL